jgi:hypothetical protein
VFLKSKFYQELFMDFFFNRFSPKQLAASALGLILGTSAVHAGYDKHFDSDDGKRFTRIATFPVFLNSSIDNETVAEIVAVSQDGKTLLYTDGKQNAIGFVDIRKPRKPEAAGMVNLEGEPTSVAVKGGYALAAVNTSEDYVAVSGELVVIDIESRTIVKTLPLGGQPDSIAVSPDGKYAAVVIENERDEDLGDGRNPQMPPGKLMVVDLQLWTTKEVDLTGLSGMLFDSDPEPEYVDINDDNIALISAQENNHIILVDLKKARVVNHFSAGTQNLDNIDIFEDDIITPNASLSNVKREPDGISWITNTLFATADEGDLDGGSRGFTIYHKNGTVMYESDETVEHAVIRHGHYPEGRSENKGNEPENVEVGTYKDGNKYLFVGSERASVTLVYNVNNPTRPVLKQVLPTSVAPEGLLAIPERNLFVAAGEEDARGDKMRSALTIYKYNGQKANYPTVVSANGPEGTPIPWGALSGLAADPQDKDIMYTIHDSFYNKARIFEMTIDKKPAVIKREIILNDSMNKLAAVNGLMVNGDGTVNLDQEGIAIRQSGGFWIASEGAGSVNDPARPVETMNLILGVKADGTIDQVITLPESTNARQIRFGFEGVTSIGKAEDETLFVAFQREWAGDAKGFARIGRYEVNKGKWSFYYYPLETPLSANGGWVGLSDITAISKNKFLVIERDNQANADAEIKRVYKFSIKGLTPLADSDAINSPNFPVVKKKLKKDLMKILDKTNGLTLEKIEGLAKTRDGKLYIVNDNDGVDDSNGETQLLKIN